MKSWKLFPLCLLLLTLVALFACGDRGTTAGQPKETVTITFSVDGNTTVLPLEKGTLPVFPGSTEKAGDADGIYTFTGWDKELVPAEGDMTYTAQYDFEKYGMTEVIWKTQGGGETVTYVRTGTVPTPPETETRVVTKDVVYTLTGWNRKIQEATGPMETYRAQYSLAARQYRVTFRVGGKTCAVTDCDWGKAPVFPGTVLPQKKGCSFVGWTNAGSGITGDTVCEAMFSVGDPVQLLWSYEHPLMAFGGAITGDSGNEIMSRAAACICLLIEYRRCPTGSGPLYRDRAAEHIANVVKAGNAPTFNLNCYWAYPAVSAAIALAHETPGVWALLDDETKERLSFFMESFAYILALGTDDDNNYTTGPGLFGNYNKTWNPNYRLAMVTPMLFVSRFFGGAEKVNDLLLAFDYDRQIGRYLAYGFDRAYACWTTPAPVTAEGTVCPSPREFMMNGGPAFLAGGTDDASIRTGNYAGRPAGSGVGVRTKYTYLGHTLDDVSGIFNELLAFCYSGGEVRSTAGAYPDGSPKAYIVDSTVSSVEGLPGMMFEFYASDAGNGTDGADLRSSAGYCAHDFDMIVASLSVMRELDMYNIEAEENAANFRLMWVGNTDLIYKLAHGYQSYALGHPYDYINRDDTKDGYLVWKSWWQEKYGKLTYSRLP